jgi:hypothetical protein
MRQAFAKRSIGLYPWGEQPETYLPSQRIVQQPVAQSPASSHEFQIAMTTDAGLELKLFCVFKTHAYQFALPSYGLIREHALAAYPMAAKDLGLG